MIQATGDENMRAASRHTATTTAAYSSALRRMQCPGRAGAKRPRKGEAERRQGSVKSRAVRLRPVRLSQQMPRVRRMVDAIVLQG